MSGELNGNDTPTQAAMPAVGVPESVAFAEDAEQHNESMKTLVLGALGVVYGDIGTSPIYAFREALHAAASDGRAGCSAPARRSPGRHPPGRM